MNYNSTRSAQTEYTVDKSMKAMLQGISPDGGLFVPEAIPTISAENIAKMQGMSYQEIAYEIMRLYLDDFTQGELQACIDKAYKKFTHPEVVPLHKLDGGVFMMELFHGATSAFKDVALSILPHYLTIALDKSGESRDILILVATSGDTGKAALEGFSDVPRTGICVFYPKDGVSDVQRLQMETQQGGNVHVAAVRGNFDDCQTAVKHAFLNEDMRAKLGDRFMLSSANSINWGRLLPQVVYYFSSYAKLLANNEISMGDSINVVVPTGNFGNILAAYYAKQMGLPIHKLICASNMNNVLTEFINTGVYNANRQFHLTTSPSMDILISSNLERYLYHVSGCDHDYVNKCMDDLKQKGEYKVSDSILSAMRKDLYGGHLSEDDVNATIKSTFEQQGYLIDTHTAVALGVHTQYVRETNDNRKTIIASTASPFKFNKAVANAINCPINGTEQEIMQKLSTAANVSIPQNLASVFSLPQRFDTTLDKDALPSYIIDAVK